MNNKVEAIRRLLADASAKPRKVKNELAHQSMVAEITAHDLVLDQSPKARKLREIFRIANLYGWQLEIEKAMDDAHVILITHMSDEKIEALHHRLLHLKDCLDCGGSSPDSHAAY